MVTTRSGQGVRSRSRRGEGSRLAEDILAAGRAILEETGDESALTLRGIARRVGVAAPSIYDHFSGVEAICRQIVADSFQLFLAAVSPSLGRQLPPGEKIHRFVTDYVAFARERPGTYRVLFERWQPSAVPAAGEPAQVLLGSLLEVFAAATTGPDRPAAEAFPAALSFWLEVHGIATLPPAHPRFPWTSEAELIDFALARSGIVRDGT